MTEIESVLPSTVLARAMASRRAYCHLVKVEFDVARRSLHIYTTVLSLLPSSPPSKNFLHQALYPQTPSPSPQKHPLVRLLRNNLAQPTTPPTNRWLPLLPTPSAWPPTAPPPSSNPPASAKPSATPTKAASPPCSAATSASPPS